MKKIKNKKTIIILLVLCIGLIGITIAYFSNSTVLDNLFSTKPYGTTYTETFVSPDNWLPGDTTDKTVTVTNSGSVDEAVRISLTESWKSNNGTTLSGLIDSNGLLTDIEENSEKAAIINFSNTDDWTYNNGYYYYNYRLKPNETTSSFIESVTFNPIVSLGDTCQETESNGKKTITCNSSGEDYDNATYKLTLKIETVQYNKYMNFWNTDVAILNDQALGCNSYKMGDEITYKGSTYYVLQDSSTTDAYVVLLKKELLTAEEVNAYSTDYVSQDGEYPYYKSSTCHHNPPWGDYSGCTTDYNQSYIKTIVDGWSSNFDNDLVKINGFKSRLITKDEVFSSLNYEKYNNSPSSFGYRVSDETPDWAYISEKIYWLMTGYEDYKDEVYTLGQELNYSEVIYSYYVRPVINLKKSAIEDGCHLAINETEQNKQNKQNDYETGENVSYNNEDYCVIKNSQITDAYVTLLKLDPLTYDELITYNNGYSIGQRSYVDNKYVGVISFYSSGNCYYNSESDNNISGCSNDYNKSFVRNIINNWSSNIINDLEEVDGYRARLITDSELEHMGHSYYYGVFNGTEARYRIIKSQYDCLYLDVSYWTFGSYDDSSSTINVISNTHTGEEYKSKYVYDQYAVRPVINLKKCAITNTCE